MKHMVNMGLLWTLLCGLFSYSQTYAQCTLVCNDMVQVSIPAEGFAIVEADMILEGDSTSCPGPKSVIVELPNGQEIGDTVTCEYVTEVLDVRVIDDASGNYCWGTILVEDKLKPVIECQDTTVNCTANLSPSAIGLVTVSDNCDSSPTVNMVETVSPEACSTLFTQTISRTWHAIDESGNIALPCEQTISVVRPSLADVEFPPNFDNTDTLALLCENPDTSVSKTGFPMVDGIPIGGLCKISATYEDLLVFGCENEFSVFREWSVLDCCSGEILTHTQHIKVMDAEGPGLDCPATLTVSANGPDCDGYFLLPPANADDNCSSAIEFRTVVPGHFDQETNGGIVNALPLGTYTVTYEATDACDNQSICETMLTVADDVAPAAICDEITSVSLGSNGLADVPASVFDDGSHDACCGVEIFAKRMDEPSAPFEPTVLFDCDDIGTPIMVIVQAVDCEGNANTCMVEVNTDDKIAPVVTCPPNITIECSAWIAGGAPPSITGEPLVDENCFLDTLFYQDFENLNPCQVGTITRTFTAEDAQGHSDNCTQIITTIDTTAVHYFFPPDTVVDCSQPLDSISAGEVFSTADCELVGLSFEDEVFPIDCGLKIFRTYTFLDWCSGFDTSYTQFITVIDTNPPIWDTPFGSLDRTFGCPGDLVKPPLPKAFDYCSPADTLPVTIISDVTDTLDCENRYIRTITLSAEDTCGNVAEPFAIVLTVNDTLAPKPFIPDADLVLCAADIPPFNEIDIPAEDDCFGEVTIDLVGTEYDTTGCSGSIIRTYLLTDVCGQDTLATHTFPYADTLAPTAIDTLLGPLPCFSDIPDPLSVEFPGIDNCGGSVMGEFISDVVVDSSGCSGEVIRRWRLEDDCGNVSVVDQTILIMDTIPPAINCPGNLDLTISEDSVCLLDLLLIVGGVDNCGGPVTMSNNITGFADTLSAAFQVGTTEVVFYATDQCGNVDSCSLEVTIGEGRPPTNFCNDFDQVMNPSGITEINVDSLVMAGTFGGEDFCSDVTFDFEPAVVTCDDFSNEPTPISYTLTVTDISGNTSTCGNTMFLYDPTNVCSGLTDPIVAGRVDMHTGEAMEDLEIQLIDAAGASLTQTGEYGLFVFENIPMGATCTLQPFRNDDLLNGVSTFDILLISKHILGQQLLEGPYNLIAADVNASGSISTLDILELRKLVLQISDEFPNGNTSWRFIEADHVFTNPNDPFSEPLPESSWLTNMNSDMVGKNFIGLKVGDVNGSASANFSGENSIEDRVVGEFILSSNDMELRKGETVRVPIFTEGENTLAALQGTIDFDFGKLKFRDIHAGWMDIEAHDFAELEPGLVTLSWFDNDVFFTQPGDELFYLEFEVLENTTLANALFINSMKTPAIAYQDGGNPLNISWRIHVASTLPVDDASFFELVQNRPNPFTGETVVLFRLEEEMPVRMELIDLSGRVQVVMEQIGTKGWNEVRLKEEDFVGSGVYVYRLVTPFGSAQKRMVLQ